MIPVEADIVGRVGGSVTPDQRGLLVGGKERVGGLGGRGFLLAQAAGWPIGHGQADGRLQVAQVVVCCAGVSAALKKRKEEIHVLELTSHLITNAITNCFRPSIIYF